ncbi:phosphate/phosphite/phosphonate ABC transporter substrate-binding protein [Salinispira pacifica]|uniref:Phosphonate ABC transporter phosphate-binding periplasmic component n=1 Tax=Salinispira pacifica TaxID=1307761 RepID=V5WIC3_9SPIO|nr:phosphate/phosphite/phosphonate ABC transporter substrate-binding protein [Salinispira pacifica]AHC14921.1 Phosphonate ABC transporter phosphate-binding periplasmic component [Salinispira pacifica]
MVMRNTFVRLGLLLVLMLVLTGTVFAAGANEAEASQEEDVKYGDLRLGLVDQDGDLVADAPENEADWVDPQVLVFAYTPVEDPEVYRDVWSEFLDHLSAETGKEVQFFPVQSNAAQLEAMRAGRLHVAGFNTGSNPLAVNAAGFIPFAMMAGEDGSFGYEMEIITHVDSDITQVEDLEGRTLAFTSPTSNSGFKAPSALLKGEFDMIADEDFNTTFSGAHDASILGVANKDYEAASIANSVLARMIERGLVDESELRTIYKSQTFPTTGYGYVYNLKPELADSIRQAFFSFDWEGTQLLAEFGQNGESQFIPITYKNHWAVIRTIDEANGVSYDVN